MTARGQGKRPMVRDVPYFRVQWPAAWRPGDDIGDDRLGDGVGLRLYGEAMGERG